MSDFPSLDPAALNSDRDDRSTQRDILPTAVQNRNIRNLSFDKAQGGTLTLGGEDNGNGIFQLKDENDNVIITMDKDGQGFFDTSGNSLMTMDGTNITFKGDQADIFLNGIKNSKITAGATDGLTITTPANLDITTSSSSIHLDSITGFLDDIVLFTDELIFGSGGTIDTDGIDLNLNASGSGLDVKITADEDVDITATTGNINLFATQAAANVGKVVVKADDGLFIRNVTTPSSKFIRIEHTGSGGEIVTVTGDLDISSNGDINLNDTTRVVGEFSNSDQVTVDNSGGVSGSDSLEVSNNNGNGGVLADFYNEYSESTEIERVAPRYQMTGDTLRSRVLGQILKRAAYKKKAHYKSPDNLMTLEEHSKELDRVLIKKDWGKSIDADIRGERLSKLEYGTLLAFSSVGAVPTVAAGQTNIMGVVASFPSRISHVQDKGIPVCKTGKTFLKVAGACDVGDLLQASDEEGCAEKAGVSVSAGSLVGRSRVNKTDSGVKLIEVDLK